MDPKKFLETLGRISDTKDPEQEANPPEWVTDLAAAVTRVYVAWPKHPGTGQPLPLKKCSTGAAAGHAVTEHHLDPRAPRRFLEEWLDFTEVTPEHVEALWEEVGRELEKPVDPDSWFFNTHRAKAYLRVAVPKEARRIKDRREIADKAWGLRRQWVKNFPDQVEYKPEVHGAADVDEGDHLKELAEFQRREQELLLLKQVEGVLPEQQYRVFALRVEGCSYKAIGNALGISTGAAKAHMHHARKNPELQKRAGNWQ